MADKTGDRDDVGNQLRVNGVGAAGLIAVSQSFLNADCHGLQPSCVDPLDGLLTEDTLNRGGRVSGGAA